MNMENREAVPSKIIPIPVSALSGSPFANYFVPGAILFTIFGIGALGAAVLAWRPSTAYALELLAWDLFLGLSLLFAAPVFKGGNLEDAVRTGLYVGGTLCLAGILGPATGDMRLQFIAIVGYAGVLPTVSLLLVLLFRRTQPGLLSSNSER
jgi:hypothetical protein